MSLIQAELDLLTASECDVLHNTVHELHCHWIARALTAPFFTLGTASYLDATLDAPWQYPEMASVSNPVLSQHFHWLHMRCCEALSAMLQEPVALHETLALPGFHVFLAHEAFAEEEAASAHWDLQFEKIRWPAFDEPDFTRPLSFTLPVRLPRSGGGIHLWEVAHADAGKLPEKEREQMRRAAPKHFHGYTTGRMVVHSGLFLHQIAPITDTEAGQERITFQGHAIRCRGTWRVYW
jgi:hypothetical protein